MLIDLYRHGETEYNRESRYLGVTDLPLSEAGKSQLKPAGYTVGTVYTSPLVRTKETARILFPEAGLAEVPGFAEMDFGIFEGRNYQEMEHDPAYRAWVDSCCLAPCPGGESKEQFCDRVWEAFLPLIGTTEHLVVVAHGGTLMAIMERFALPEKSYFDWHCAPGCGFRLDDSPRPPQGRLAYIGMLDCRRGDGL